MMAVDKMTLGLVFNVIQHFQSAVKIIMFRDRVKEMAVNNVDGQSGTSRTQRRESHEVAIAVSISP
jgi:hypothetical protein